VIKVDWLLPFVYGISLLVGLIFIGLPVAFSLLLVGFIGILIWFGFEASFAMLSFTSIYYTPVNFLLLVVPLFVLMAQLLERSGSTDVLYQAFWDLFAGIRGALAAATISMGALLGACVGSSAASVATMAHIGLGQMLVRGYKKWLAAGSIAGAGGLAIVIPPSIGAIMYGFVMELPVLDIFAACMIPGLLMAAGYCLVVFLLTRFLPNSAPAGETATLTVRLRSAVTILPFFGLVLMVLGSILTGIASITESAAFGCLGAFCIALLMGRKEKITPRNFLEAGRETAISTCYILFIVVGAKVFSKFWSMTGVIDMLGQTISNMPFSPLVVLLLINLLVLFFGTILDGVTIILVVLPILGSGLTALGFDPIHLGVIFLINIEMGLTTPPLGMNLFILGGVGEKYGVSYTETVRGAIPFLLVDATVLLLVVAFPSLALWIPSLLH